MTVNPPAAAVALGDQLQARIVDLAGQILASQIPADEALTDDEQTAFDMGVSAGSSAAMLALREFGILP